MSDPVHKLTDGELREALETLAFHDVDVTVDRNRRASLFQGVRLCLLWLCSSLVWPLLSGGTVANVVLADATGIWVTAHRLRAGIALLRL